MMMMMVKWREAEACLLCLGGCGIGETRLTRGRERRRETCCGLLKDRGRTRGQDKLRNDAMIIRGKVTIFARAPFSNKQCESLLPSSPPARLLLVVLRKRAIHTH